jgi:putative tricarboxylic transport membrane protein
MAERALNVFWIVLGAAAAAGAWNIGLAGPSGPESGLFPFIAGFIVAGAGAVMLLKPSTAATAPEWPTGGALWRVAGVVAGLAVMALCVPYLGFAVSSVITMIVLLRTVEHANWIGSIALALGSVAITMWLFGSLLGMPLPRGPWGW